MSTALAAKLAPIVNVAILMGVYAWLVATRRIKP
jgi:hypothetical protein